MKAARKRALIMAGLGVALGGAAVVAAALVLRTGSPPPVTLRPNDPAVVAQGKAIYAAQCASCHGADLEGQPNWRERGPDGRLPAPPHDETGHTWHHVDAQLFSLTKYGMPKEIGNGEPYYSNMPAYESVLSDEEIIAVLSFIKRSWPVEIRKRHDQMNAQTAASQ